MNVARELRLEPWQLDSLERSFIGDATAWRDEFSQVKDVSGLVAERNLFRYVPTPVLVRLSTGAPSGALLRVLGAGLITGSKLSVSSAAALPVALQNACADFGVNIRIEAEAEWRRNAAGIDHSRVRLIGAGAKSLARATGGRPDFAIHDHAVTEAGQIELLPFLKEQAISITGHRFGTLNHLTDQVI